MHDFHYGPPRNERERERWTELVARSFSMPPAELPAWAAQLDAGVQRCLADEDGVPAVLGILDMGQWFGGRSVPMGGVLAVAVDPARRGEGLGARVMRACLEELRDRRVPLSALYPATNTLYRAVGYEVAGARHALTLRLREMALRRGAPAPDDTWLRPVRAEDEPALRALYAARARTANGWLDRHEYLWRRVRVWRGEERTGYVVGRGATLEGYVFLAQKRAELLDMEVQVSDLVATTPAAAARILGLLFDHRSLCTRASAYLAPSEPALALLAENGYESKLAMPWMLRIVDVASALAARGYAPGLAARIEFAIEDDVLPHNSGRFVLQVADGRGRVERGGSGALGLDVKALAALYSGWQSASDLAASGRARGSDADLAAASAAFAGPPPHMPDMF